KNMKGAAWVWRSAAGSSNATEGASGWSRRSAKERHSTSRCRREEQAMSDCIPVIILTTSKAEEDILRSYDLHVNSYITKPVHLSDLFEVLKTIEDFWFGIVKLPAR